MEANGDRQPLNEISLNSEEARDMSKDSMTKEERERHNIKLRREYRKLYDDIQESEEAIVKGGKGSASLVGKFTDKATELYSQIIDPPEAVLDAKVVKNLSRIVRREAEALSSNVTTFDSESYARKLVTVLNGQWDEESGTGCLTANQLVNFGQIARAAFRRATPLNYVRGSFNLHNEETGTSSQKPKQARRKTLPSQLVATQAEVQTQATQSATGDQTERKVVAILRQLKSAYIQNNKEPINYFKFILDPESFGRSVENTFHVSFLVKEGHCAVKVDSEKGYPVIKPSKPVKETEEGAPDPLKYQVVFNLSVPLWEELKTVLKVDKAMIDHEED